MQVCNASGVQGSGFRVTDSSRGLGSRSLSVTDMPVKAANTLRQDMVLLTPAQGRVDAGKYIYHRIYFHLSSDGVRSSLENC